MTLNKYIGQTEFYRGSSSIVNGKIVYNIFSQTGPEIHARWRKPISKYITPRIVCYPLSLMLTMLLRQLHSVS